VRFGLEKFRDPVILHTMASSSLGQAIERACAGRTSSGGRFRQDQYIAESAVCVLTDRLTGHARQVAAASGFDVRYDLIRELSPKGIGPGKAFDAAMRIGAYLQDDLETSERLYLHRGPLIGWKNLTGERGSPCHVPIGRVPAPLRRLPHYTAEDLLCEYRLLVHPGMLCREKNYDHQQRHTNDQARTRVNNDPL
jgi:hypothetical protein